MSLSLRPAVFQKLCQIGSLFQEEKRTEFYYKKKMLKKLSSCQFHSRVKMASKFEIVTGTAAIVDQRRLLFWPAKNVENRTDFDLFGIERTGWETDGLGMVITNAAGNVLGLMPHLERACDSTTGGVDGRTLMQALLA